MSKIFKSFSELVGKTPLIELVNYEKMNNTKAKIFAKLEYFNPGGSIKDRVAVEMINDAEKRRVLKKGGTIIEPTSGNTGIGLCAVAASRGYKIIITMPETMSIERRQLMKAYGAGLVLTEGVKGMSGAIEKADELSKSIPNSFLAGQFVNPANPTAHYNTTGPEIWNDLDGEVDVLVSCIGTGGTISGVGKYLKEKNQNIKIIAVEPLSSNVLSGGKAGPHKIQGIGAGFIPKTLNTEIYDEIITINNEECFESSRELAKMEGILVGISSGAALSAVNKIASREEYSGKNIVVILPDTGERYLSAGLFE